MHIDIAIPTQESGNILRETLSRAASAVEHSEASVGQLIIVDDDSDDETTAVAGDCAAEYGWDLTTIVEESTLPEARERAIGAVDTEWFWFLDDDVRVRAHYLSTLLSWTDSERVGAVQGRKASRDEHPTEWHRRRARRGGTHATLVRTDAVRDVSIPSDVTVLEDEYLRRWTEVAGYTWVQEYDAVFDHDCQDRHPIGWTEGRVAGQYGLKPFHELALNVPFAAATGRNPLPHAKRALGWISGRRQAESSDPVAEGAGRYKAMTDGGER